MGKYQPFEDLDDETNDALKRSIARFGVVCPIVVDGNGSIIDGHQRARIAGELGLTYTVIKRAVKNADDAIALAYSLNADRRHMTVEQRREIVADLRAQGYSLRAIVGVTKTSIGTAHNDVKASGVQPEHVTGTDGRNYSPTRGDEDRPDDVDENGEITSTNVDTAISGSDQSTSVQTGTTDTPTGAEDAAGPGDDEQGYDGDAPVSSPASSPAPKVAPPESPEQRDARIREEQRVERNANFGQYLIGMWALLGDGNKPVDALIGGWVPEECPMWLVDAHKPVFTPDGIREVAAVMEKLAARWESHV